MCAGLKQLSSRPSSRAEGVSHQQVAVFLNLGSDGQGYVAPAGSGPVKVDLANSHKRIPKAIKELTDLYDFHGFDQSPLHRTLKLFSDFLARGRRHEIDGRLNEALLHYVIALELVFGDSQAIQRSVSERVALITFRENGKSYKKQCDWVEWIYALRSRYVHSGAEITDNSALDQLGEVCEQVFRSLMRLQAAHVGQRDETVLKSWLRELDYLAKGIVAGKRPTESQLREAFIL